MDTQVIVVGAGPVGLMLAGELRLGGARVLVVDRLAEPTTESRASTLHARTMEIFDQRGLLSYVGTPPNDRMGHFGGIPLDLGHLPTRYPGQWKVGQTRVEEFLAEWATGLGAEIRRAHELVDLTAFDDHVRVRLATDAGPVELTCAYLVGCDGEDSTVRRLAGIDFPGRDATRELLRADVAGIDIPNRRFQRLPNGLAISATRDGVTRVMVTEFDREAPRRRTEPSFEDVCVTWKRVTGEDISGGTPLWLNAFGNASRQAARYRAGRVLLAGDAAHLQLPAGGQAINLGIQDAVNLGWKLAAEVSGHAPPGLLDTYHTERHAVGRRVLANIETQAYLLLGDSTVEPVRTLLAELITRPSVRDHLAATIAGLDVRYGDDPHPLVGARVPYADLCRKISTINLLHSGRGILLDFSASLARHAWLRATVSDRVTVAPSLSRFEGLDTILVRPDGYVAWVSSTMDDPRPALHRWFGR
ncbi:MAG TPA: FAD-dependent monooxygenase [Actinophytocola sp.]|uniref:FAD-dependent monooxygenase n=1 Tax=Actinophytocola sp. TaxID=1872138 RepID=UPI002DDD3C02|nr:FAD-dependent monooxygenase [Actinophytocola sp.]HEV2780506.1 FAD-dependent monooxygenase [Actinophytocola sp.]